MIFDTPSRLSLGPTQTPIQWERGALFLGVKKPGCETDHSPPSSAEVKEHVELYLRPQYAFMVWCSVKRKHEQLYLYLTSQNVLHDTTIEKHSSN
jgi:hypothetical protein